jgi:hypothetical protein
VTLQLKKGDEEVVTEIRNRVYTRKTKT